MRRRVPPAPLALLALLACSVVLAVEARAQQRTADRREAGRDARGVVREVGQLDAFLSPAQARHAAQAKATLGRMLDVLRAAPALNPPVGFDLMPTLIARSRRPEADATLPIRYEVDGLLYWYHWNAGKVVPTPVAMGRVSLTGNDPHLPLVRLERWPYAKRDSFYFEPIAVESDGGAPVWRAADRDFEVIARRDVPLWVPVGRGEIVSAFIAEAGRRDPAVRSCLERRLALMSPAERAEPAWVTIGAYPKADDCEVTVPAGTPRARRIVRANPDYFDRSLPPTALQVIVVSHVGKHTDRGWRADATRRIVGSLDREALRALLAP